MLKMFNMLKMLKMFKISIGCCGSLWPLLLFPSLHLMGVLSSRQPENVARVNPKPNSNSDSNPDLGGKQDAICTHAS